jgi:ketosteroid isomerase-like protein
MRSKRYRTLPVALFLLAGLVACHPHRAPADIANVEAESESIRTQATAWFQAIAEKDLEKTLSFYAPDAQYLAAGRPPVSTADERRRYWTEDYATPGFSSEEKTTKIEVARSGDLAYQRGTYVLSAQDDRGKLTQSAGKFVVVWKKQSDGQWKAIIDIDNADQ